MNKLPDVYEFKPFERPSHIIVLGCGGTGAYTIAFLARILSTMERPPRLTIVDGDIVEEKNLLRQHFISQDIAQNKAEVLAERYAAAFGLTINAVPQEIKTSKELVEVCGPGNIKLIIGCVDNNASRKLIYDTYFNNKIKQDVYWIDSGNEEKNGQVVVGFQNNSYKDTDSYFCLPCVMELYPEMLEGQQRFNSDLSCAERAVSSPQNMMTNITAATIITNYAQKIIFGEPLKSHATSFSINNVFSTRLNLSETLSAVKPERKRS